MINVHLAHEKSMIEHRSSNVSHPVGNGVCAQPSVSHKEGEFKIQILNMGPASVQVRILKRMIGNQQPKELKMRLRVGLKMSKKEETPFKPWGKDYEAIFRKYISIGEDGEEHYDVIDMEREAQRAVRRIQDHQEIVKQYKKVVRAYNNFMGEYPWMTEGLMQDNCRFGDMLKDEKRESQFKYELGRLMGEYAVPLPLGNFNLNSKETRRLELWKNRRGTWFDHVEHMEEGQEQNKEWENFWWTVDEDMFTYMMKEQN